MIEIRAHAIHLIDERDARHAILIGLAPHGFGLRLHAGHRVKHRNRAVQHAQRALDFHGEVHVARCVDNIDTRALAKARPESGGRRGGDGDAPLALLLHPVHGGRAVVHLADLVRHAGIKQDAFGRGGLAGVDVRHDPDVARILEFVWPGHFYSFRFSPELLPIRFHE